MAAAKEEEEFAEAEELEVADILCAFARLVRSRERKRRRRRQAPEIPSWGRRRPRSMPEDKPSPAPAPAGAGKDGAASPDTPLAYPESGADDAPPEEQHALALPATNNAVPPHQSQQWTEKQHGGAVASLSSQQNPRLLQVVKGEEQEPARDPRAAASVPALVVLDLNEPARAAGEEDEQQALQLQLQLQARAQAAAAEWYRQAQLRAALQKAAVSADARRRRLEILRAKAACPLVSSRARRAG